MTSTAIVTAGRTISLVLAGFSAQPRLLWQPTAMEGSSYVVGSGFNMGNGAISESKQVKKQKPQETIYSPNFMCNGAVGCDLPTSTLMAF